VSEQMVLRDYRVVVLVVTAVIALLVASPALQHLLTLPQTEFFTEFWMLDSNHQANNYPSNITRNVDYSVFLGLGNHLGHAAYYQIQVKFRNQTQPAPDTFNRTSSSLPPLYIINVFVADNGTWELPITFSFDYAYDASLSRITFTHLVLNGNSLDVSSYVASWDEEGERFYGNLFFELWVYNQTTSGFQYHERFLDLKLNMQI
jgi:hypothetical protein